MKIKEKNNYLNRQMSIRLKLARFRVYSREHINVEKELSEIIALGYVYMILSLTTSKSGVNKLSGFINFNTEKRSATLEKINPNILWKKRTLSVPETIAKYKANGVYKEYGEVGKPKVDTTRDHCEYGGNLRKLCNHEECMVCFNRSFASSEFAKFWHPDNILKARDVFKSSNAEYTFFCTKCNHSINRKLSKLTSTKPKDFCSYCNHKKICYDENCQHCLEASFKSHELSIYWSENNPIPPRNAFKGSSDIYEFKCPDCLHYFSHPLNKISGRGDFCIYCSRHALCSNNKCLMCFNNSFLSSPMSKFWSPKNLCYPRDVSKYSNESFLFDCPLCNHTYPGMLNNIADKETFCPFCSHQRLCGNCAFCFNMSFKSSPHLHMYSSKNEIPPEQVFKHSNVKRIFNCGDCKSEFLARPICVSRSVKYCPICRYKTEKLIFEYLLKIYPDIERQSKFSWSKSKTTNKYYSFDFYIPSFSIIIELDGEQHFRDVLNWKTSDKHRERDIDKMKLSLSNNISMIRLLQWDVYYDRNNWKEKLEKALYKRETPTVEYLTESDIYQKHIDELGY